MTMPEAGARWQRFLDSARQQAAAPQSTLEAGGTLTRLTGLVLEAVGIRVPVGSQCLISRGHSRRCWPRWSAFPATVLS